LGEANDLDHLDDLFENVAVVFFPFHTSLVTFSSLNQLLDEFNAHIILHRSTFLNANGPWDRCDFYVGNRSSYDLANVKRFFDYHGWRNDHIWRYDIVVMVGYNTLSGEIVDVPASAFPWCIDYFGVSGSNILDLPVVIDPDDTHQLTAACLPCSRGNTRCVRVHGGPCRRCVDCKPQKTREIANKASTFINSILSERSVFCPAFQYVIATCCAASGYSRAYTAYEKVILKNIVEDEAIVGRVFAKEAMIRERCAAYQLVALEHGRLRIIESVGAEEKIGFTAFSTLNYKSKKAVGMLLPSFGISIPFRAYSLYNSALRSPGEIFVADLNLWNKDLQVIASRIMMLAQFETVDDLFIMVGWM
jgi:hypothetical protein